MKNVNRKEHLSVLVRILFNKYLNDMTKYNIFSFILNMLGNNSSLWPIFESNYFGNFVKNEKLLYSKHKCEKKSSELN